MGTAPSVELPPALPESSGPIEGRPVPAAAPTMAVPPAPARPIRLADALAMSLRNVETVQANISVRTATVARFEALKAFVPLVNLPTFAVGFNRIGGPAMGKRHLPRHHRRHAARRPARPQLCQHQSI